MECGQDPSQFWSLTPHEISVIMDGAVSRLRRERSELAWLAWHIEALARTKKLPTLESLLGNQKRPTGRRMSPEQIEAITRSWLSSRTKR